MIVEGDNQRQEKQGPSGTRAKNKARSDKRIRLQLDKGSLGSGELPSTRAREVSSKNRKKVFARFANQDDLNEMGRERLIALCSSHTTKAATATIRSRITGKGQRKSRIVANRCTPILRYVESIWNDGEQHL